MEKNTTGKAQRGPKCKDLTGMRFGRLTVIEFAGYKTTRCLRIGQWKCKCDCGNICIVCANNLTSGNTRSCGCIRRGAPPRYVKHGDSGTSLYRIYMRTIYSCYRYSGEPGVKLPRMGVCPEWLGGDTYQNRDATAGYLAFKEWAMRPVSEGGGGYNGAKRMCLTRLDVTKGYGPDNCVFMAKVAIRIDGVEGDKSMTVSQVAKLYGVTPGYVSIRIKSNWSANALIHTLKHPELEMRKIRGHDAYYDKDWIYVDIPDYGAEIIKPQ